MNIAIKVQVCRVNVQRMQNESVDIKQLGLVGRTKDQILDELKDLYIAQ